MGTKQEPGDLAAPTAADLRGSASIEEIAAREGWTPDSYTIALAERLRASGQPLAGQVERLRALAGAGTDAGRASAAELGRHALLMSALMERFALAAAAVDPTTPRGADVAGRITNAAIKCQRAAQSALGALAVLRQGEHPTTPETAPTAPGGGLGRG